MSAGQHGYITKDYALYDTGIEVPANSSRLVVSRDIPISDAASLNFSLHIDVEDVTIGSDEEIKFYLQQMRNGQWMDVGDPQAVVSVNSGAGTYCILLSIGVEMEALVMPLSNVARLTVDSGATSTAKVTQVTAYNRV